MDFMKIANRIYKHIVDEESKQVFENRLMYSLTSDYKYIRNLVENTEVSQAILKSINSFQSNGNDLVLDGAGEYGFFVYNDYPEVNWKAISDASEKTKYDFGSFPVLSRKEVVKKYPNAIFVVTSIKYYKEIKNELLDLGVDDSHILEIGKKVKDIENRMYFDITSIKPENYNCFVDCGAYHGESSEAFIKWCGNNQYRIIALEPDENSFHILKNAFENRNECTLINAGSYSERGCLSFSKTGTRASQISEDGDARIETVAIDDVCKDQKITFLKLDVEGAEYETLVGARKVIKRDKPVIAISVYHKPNDIIYLLDYVLKIEPNYRFVFKHYTLGYFDTVAFAICD